MIDAAVELNAIPRLQDALPRLVELAVELTGADTASVVFWDAGLACGTVRAAAGIAAERVGRTTRNPDSLPARAVRTGAPQIGPMGSTGYTPEIDAELAHVRTCVSVPVLGGDQPATIQVGWLEQIDADELDRVAAALAQLAGLTSIGRRTQGERMRQAERDRLEAVVAAAGDGILVQRAGCWTANPAAQRILALPDERVPDERTLNARRLDGTPIEIGERFDDRFRIRMTSLAGEELVLDGSTSTGDLRVIVFRDVTEEYRRAYLNAEFLRSLLDSIPTPICVVERDTRRVLSTNPAFCQLVGLSEADVLGAVHPYPWWHDGERGREIADGDRYQRVYRDADGRPLPVELHLKDVRDDDGRATAYIAVVTDLSERRRFEQQLVQSGKLAAIGELAAGVAHEINNPLFAILGLVEFLLNDAEPGTKSHGRLELIRQTSLEIKEIVRSLLDFARESSDEVRLVELDAVVEETVALVRKTSANRGVEIEVRTADGPFLVDGSSNQLKQIFLNLLANARQAMPNGGTVTISLETDGDHIVATVADGGPGIAPEELQRIFEPFYTTRRATGGTGLGLSVSVGIAHNHGGSLTASSEPGQGAAFALRLPRHEAA